jgi:hypothetical protein
MPKHIEEEETYPPRGANTELEVQVGSVSSPVKFKFSTAKQRYTERLNQILMILPLLLERLQATEGGVYAPEQAVINVAANYTATENDYLILCDASGDPFNVTLPAATLRGKTYIIVKKDSGENAVGVVPYGTNTIEGDASKSLAAQWDKVILTADGSETWINEGASEI